MVKPSIGVFLRKHGFKIVSRPPNTEPRWQKKGKVYLESQARAIAQAEKQRGC
jgi:hypothetical protein